MNHEPLPAQGPVDVLVSRLIAMHNNPPSKIGWVEQTTLRDACEMLAQMRRLLNELTIENVTYWDNAGEVRHDVGGSQAQAMQTFREARSLLANARSEPTEPLAAKVGSTEPLAAKVGSTDGLCHTREE